MGDTVAAIADALTRVEERGEIATRIELSAGTYLDMASYWNNYNRGMLGAGKMPEDIHRVNESGGTFYGVPVHVTPEPYYKVQVNSAWPTPDGSTTMKSR